MTTGSRSSKRIKFIHYIYQNELMGNGFSHVEAFESGDFNESEMKIIEAIEKNYNKYTNIVSKFLASNWTFARLSALERAILIFGAFELSIKMSSPAETINEIVNYTKMFIPGDNYKFINKSLDQIKEYYEEIKNSKVTA